MIRVVVADDQELVRTGFRLILAGEPGISVVGDAADGRAAVQLTRRLRPDVVLMDIRMPVLDGLAATQALVADPDCASRVLVLTTFDDDGYVFAALEAGASGYLLKDAPAEQLVSAIHVVASGEAILAPAVTTRLVREVATRRRDPDSVSRRRPVQRRDRRRAGPVRGHRQDARGPHPREARRPRPGPGRRDGVPVRTRSLTGVPRQSAASAPRENAASRSCLE